jgi:uncharacterized protein YpuA (DUF1002 family)
MRLEQQWKNALQLKSEVEAASQIAQEQLQTLKDTKQKEDAEHVDLMAKLKRQMQEMKEDFNSKKERYEE